MAVIVRFLEMPLLWQCINLQVTPPPFSPNPLPSAIRLPAGQLVAAINVTVLKL